MQVTVLKQSFEVLDGLDNVQNRLRLLEKIGRTAYKSEDKITHDSCLKFLKMIKENPLIKLHNHFTNISLDFFTK